MTLRAAEYEAVFLPELGMLGTSLRYRGTQLLSLHGGLDAFRGGHTTGMPLLAPWANRLARRRFRLGPGVVDLTGPGVHLDENGLPIHGRMLGAVRWEVVRREPARLVARHAYDDDAFPFPHELEIDARLGEDGLQVETSLRPTSRRAVPVSFGWHPYLRLPGPRTSWRLRLPARRHLELDERGLPTGRSAPERAEDAPLGTRTFDDLYALGRDARLAVAGGDLRIEIRYGRGYPFAQVYAPPGKRFVSLEPMTAPTNALVTGQCPFAPPRERFSATFTICASGP